MADPTKYMISYSFSGWQASNPAKPLPAQHVDDQFAGIQTSIGQLVDAVKDVRRSDGKLKNASVTIDSLADEVKVPWTGGAIAAWAPVVVYAAGIAATAVAPATVVTYNGETYLCTVAHTTTALFEAGKWEKIAAKGASGSGAGDMVAANNLSDVTDAAQARANLDVPANGELATTLAGYLSKSGNLAGLGDAQAARANLGLKSVASTGAYSSLTGKPTLGTAAAKNVGTAAGDIVEVQTGGKLPALDGSALTGLSSARIVGIYQYGASGTHTVSAGVTRVMRLLFGAGGNGGLYSPGVGGNGGVGGFTADYKTVTPGETITFTIGTGGTDPAGSSACGTLAATGGSRGGNGNGSPGVNGSGSGGEINGNGTAFTAALRAAMGANFDNLFEGLDFSQATYTTVRPPGSGATVAWSVGSGYLPGASGGGATSNSPGNQAQGMGGALFVLEFK